MSILTPEPEKVGWVNNRTGEWLCLYCGWKALDEELTSIDCNHWGYYHPIKKIPFYECSICCRTQEEQQAEMKWEKEHPV